MTDAPTTARPDQGSAGPEGSTLPPPSGGDESEPPDRSLTALQGVLLAVGIAVALAFVGNAITDGGPSVYVPPADEFDLGEGDTDGAVGEGTFGGSAVERPDLPPIDCDRLLTFDDVADAMATLGGATTGSLRTSFGETCHDEIADDPDTFVTITPGLPADLVGGEVLAGSTGELVEGVGDAARWFVGTGVGVLAVESSSEHGLVNVRIAVGGTGVDDATRRDVAADLARTALPRFPGVDPGNPDEIVREEDCVLGACATSDYYSLD